MRVNKIYSIVATVAILCALKIEGLGSDSGGPGPQYDCGTIALANLLCLEGVEMTVKDVESRLPPPSPQGYSMKQLRDAAQACGLRLTGVFLKDDESIDRPMLVYLRREQKHGHFLVVRPVGHTGKLAQVIDTTGPPEVVDKARIRASREWTGIALVPSGTARRVNWVAILTACAVAAVGSLIFSLWRLRH